MVDLLLKARVIYTMDESRRIIRDGAVAIEGDHIVDVGPRSELIEKYAAERIIDASSKALLPGFVDTHTHLAENFVRGVYGVVEDGLNEVLFPATKFIEPRHAYSFGLVACVEALNAGITTVQESLTHMDAFAKAVEQTGLRANIGEEISDFDYQKVKDGEYVYLPEQSKEMYERAVKLADTWHGKADGRIQVCFHPLDPHMCTPELYEKVKEEASSRGLKITTHLACSLDEVRQVKRLYGKTPVEHLRDLGVLGENLFAAHCIYATETDLKILRETDTRILHCPRSWLLHGITVPLARWLEMGIKVGLGTDDVYHTMWETMRAALYAAQVRFASEKAPRPPTFYELLELATIKGAKAIGMHGEIGSIERGKKADLQLIDLHDPHLTPTVDLTSSLVLYGSTASVDTVIVNGRVVKDNGVITTVDADLWIDQAQNLSDELWKKIFSAFPKLEKQVR